MEDIIKNMFCSGSDCFKDDFFNKQLQNGVITHLNYKNISLEQNPNILFPFNKLIQTIRPSLIIEIGTFAGGLTLLLRDLLDYNGLTKTKVITYDVNDPHYLQKIIKGLNIISKTQNLFSDDYSKFRDENSMNEITKLISENEKILVLCDGGSKMNEFRIISPLLKSGDVIMAHDYSYNEEYFQENIKEKYWNWLEIQDRDINNSCVEFNLIPFLQEEFINVAWVCKIKD
jgi:cephalosporin hydroxylase